MRRLAWIDGRVVESQMVPTGEPYVMQRIHTLQGRAYNVSRHVALLRDATEEMFGFAPLIGVEEVERIIGQLLRDSYATMQVSIPVVMRIGSRGEHIFILESPTFGVGAYLRAKRITVAPVYYRATLGECPTSVSVAHDAMLDCSSRINGGERALPITDDGYVVSRAWSPLFVVADGVVYTPMEHHSVEYLMAHAAIVAAGFRLVVCPIPLSLLDKVDELLYVDVMGISSCAKIGNHRLTSSAAVRIAEKMLP